MKVKKGGFWYRWLYIRRCECCNVEIDVRKDDYYVSAFNYPALCAPCFRHCSMTNGKWDHRDSFWHHTIIDGKWKHMESKKGP